MKVLFVSSGNKKEGISSIVFNQGESLRKKGLKIEYFGIIGKGFIGYLKNLPALKRKINSDKFDVIHAHYSLSALTVSLTLPKIPVIVSLMGSDAKMSLFWNFIIRLSNQFLWHHTIVKSDNLKKKIKLKNASIIPNGVDLSKFEIKNKIKTREKLGLSPDLKYILFLSNPNRIEKNYKLATKSFDIISDDKMKLLPVYNKPNDEIVDYLNACDLLLLTSLWEGSPNAVKEAMTCNLPVVSTDVGDVKWLFGNEPGYFLTSYDLNDVAEKIKSALQYTKNFNSTNGRKRIIELGLDSQTVAKKIINVYKEVLNKSA